MQITSRMKNQLGECDSDPFDVSDGESDNDSVEELDFSEIEKYFDSDQFSEFSNFEKKVMLNQKRKYEVFMEKHNCDNTQSPVLKIAPPYFMKNYEEKLAKLKEREVKQKKRSLSKENASNPASKKAKTVNMLPESSIKRFSSRLVQKREAIAAQSEINDSETPTGIEEEEDSILKSFFTPTEWSGMNFVAKKHVKNAFDTYNKAVAE
ncbi:Streptogrisin-D, partial [Frankliniella fusca]